MVKLVSGDTLARCMVLLSASLTGRVGGLYRPGVGVCSHAKFAREASDDR